MTELDIQQRVRLSMALERYVSAVETLAKSLGNAVTANLQLRASLKANQRIVVRANYQHYLVQTDANMRLTVEPIDVI